MSLTRDEINNIEKELENLSNIDKCEKIKISIIVPAFNVENYLSRCLMSLIKQTESDIEIIIINDGSDDDTEKIALLFANHDHRIIYLKQEHKLQGAARNIGIKIARGEYIGFVDADDWIDTDYYENLYSAAKKYNSDLALGTNTRIGNGRTKKRLNIEKEDFYTTLQAKIDICNQWKDGCPTNKIYRTDFLKKFNILYPEGVYCEDKLFTTKALYYSNGIVTVPNIYYYYYRNPNSTVNTKIKTDKYKKDKNDARLKVLSFLKEQKAQIRDKDFWAITKQIRFCKIPVLIKKESLHTANYYLFSFIKIKEEKI